jgi:hypothetical protein
MNYIKIHIGKVGPEGTVDARAANIASGENAKFEYSVRWFTAAGEIANFEYPVRWLDAKEGDGANSDEAAKVKYYSKWFAGPEYGVLDSAKLEYYPKWFASLDAVTALDAKGENATFEYYPKWFAAEDTASPVKEGADKAAGSFDKAANVLY